ncbi:cysteine-rich CWC family protein [Pseudomonas sp. sia0905]|uniref:cysteine-rich CWC family protein n=1 Tax=Pseudomonas sp. sia0905 TaxID=2854783 RepID=UPI001C4460C5|nr:cysteine-rich CWC family protein [Pseudomonas sp. sia0905]
MNTERCPLCGKANGCVIAAGQSDVPCWCFEAQIDPTALERLTPEQRNQACLCPACAGAVRIAASRKQDGEPD